MSAVGKSSQRYSGFDPRTLGNCALWLDAADPQTLFTDTAATTRAQAGQAVARWNDKSGNGNYLQQATSSNRPVLSNYSSVLPSVYFATNGLSLVSISNSASTGNTARTVFLVQVAPNASSITRVGTGTHVSNTPPTAFGLDNNTSSSNLYVPYDYNTTTTITRSVLLRTPSVLYGYYDSTASQTGGGYSFGNFLTSSTTLNTGATPWYFGLRPDNAGCVDSYIAEFIHFNRLLTTAERQQVEGYLAWKWGISSSFQPTSISGLSLWLDAADSTTLTLSGSNVTQWRDKSSNVNHASQYLTSNVPTLSNSLRQSVYFAGSNFLATANPLPIFTLFVVGRHTGTSGGNFLTSSVSTGNHGAYYAAFKSDVNFGIVNTLDQPIAANNTSTTSNVDYILTGSYNTTTVSALINGGQLSNSVSFSGTPKTSLRAFIGANWYGGVIYFNFQGHINEFIAFSTILTTSERQQVEDYLSRKWNVSLSRTILNLPSSHPFQLAPPVLRPFNPTDIANCALWLDAADSRTLTLSGSNVTAWADKSGNGRNATQATSARQPSYSGTNRWLYFNGTNLNFLNLPDGTFPSGNSVYSIFSTVTPVSGFIHAGGGLNLSNQALFFGWNLPTNGLFDAWNTVDFNTATYTPSISNKDTVLGYFYNGSLRYIDVNGTNIGSLASSNRNSSSLSNAIGGYLAQNAYSTFYLREFIIYSQALTTSQVQQVESYLATKWGLQGSTPSTHPARIAPALTVQFQPTLLSNCALWLDGADQKTLTFSGSNVTAWADKSGNANNATQGTLSLAPTYSTTALNSRLPGLVFTNSGGFTGGATNTPSNFSIMWFPNLQSGTNDASYFAVFQYSSGGSTVINNFKSQYNQYYALSADSVQIIAASTYLPQTISFTRPTTPAMVSFSVATGSTNTLIGGLNGTMQSNISNVTPPASTTDNNPLGIIGTYFENPNIYGTPFVGTISELLIFTRSLSTAERQQVEGYLATKWGLQGSLPASHPYKNTPLL